MLYRKKKLFIAFLVVLLCYMWLSYTGKHNFLNAFFVKEVEKMEKVHLETHYLKNNNHLVEGRQVTKSRPDTGYIVAFNIWEQQTMATGSLLQLQCFAGMLNLSVVQPFMNNSRFLVPMNQVEANQVEATQMLRMESMFIMEKWNEHARIQGYAPLVSYKEFLEHAPRNAILVQMKYPTSRFIKKAKKKGIKFSHPVSKTRNYERGCDYKFINKAFAELQVYNFSVVGRLCYNFLTGDRVPLHIFVKDLSGLERSITILVDKWRGIGSDTRLLVDKNACTFSSVYRNKLEFSPALHEDAAAYIKKYITNDTSEDYLAVMARFEMAGLTRRLSTNPHVIMSYCLKETLEKLEGMKEVYKLDKVFVAMDIGKYGSRTFKVKMYWGLFQNMTSFLKDAYKEKMDIESWERSFEDVARFKDAGYIANLQLLVVANAKCVLFVGGGSFQSHALSMFKIHHPQRAMCVKCIEKCTI